LVDTAWCFETEDEMRLAKGIIATAATAALGAGVALPAAAQSAYSGQGHGPWGIRYPKSEDDPRKN
jgi:hypothetical protein